MNLRQKKITLNSKIGCY